MGGYSTSFQGSFGVETYIDDDTINLIKGLNATRRMKRDIKTLANELKISVKQCLEYYLEDGQLYTEGSDSLKELNIIDANEPPIDQPSLYCKWTVDVEDNSIIWDGTGL
jgi:hypothetical protein